MERTFQHGISIGNHKDHEEHKGFNIIVELAFVAFVNFVVKN
jgi:hypothetical protein